MKNTDKRYGLFYGLHVADIAITTNTAFISVYPVMLSSKESDFSITIHMWESQVEK